MNEQLEKAKQEFDQKLHEESGKHMEISDPLAKEYVMYAKLLELQEKIEQLHSKLSASAS